MAEQTTDETLGATAPTVLRPGAKKRSRNFVVIQVVSMLAAFLLGSLVLATKGNAQGRPAATSAFPAVGARLPAPSPSTSPSLVVAPSAAPRKDDAKDKKEPAADEKKDDVSQALATAALATDEDLSKLSEEEKSAIGTGKVPIHREGKFRSPFANPSFGGPAKAKVGLVIDEIRSYDIQTGTFEAHFFLSLTSDKKMPKINFDFPNGHEVNCEPSADTDTFKFYRCSGSFTTDVDLRAYPFDTQKLTIAIEDKAAGVDQLIFEADPNRTSLNSEFHMSGWGVANVGARAYEHLYPPRFDRDDLYVSRYKFTLGIDRFATSAAFSVFVPAFIIVIISLMGLWVPPSELEVRSNAGAPMLAAAVLFHFSLIQALPATGYLTRADKLMLAVYVSLLLNMLTTWTFLLVDEEHVDAWFRRFRAWIPPLTGAVMLIGSFV
mgnify:CR=1 FL=1